jgi:hypothetical protein
VAAFIFFGIAPQDYEDGCKFNSGDVVPWAFEGGTGYAVQNIFL